MKPKFRTVEERLNKQADCFEKPLPKFKRMFVQGQRTYLKGWLGCDECPLDVCNVYRTLAPVEPGKKATDYK